MAVVYDNWERLVRATLRREQLRESGLRTPSDVSLASLSASSNSFNFSFPSTQYSSSNLLAGKAFTYHQILQATNYLSKSNFIQHGRSGELFYGVLEDGLQVVVKKIDQSVLSYSLSELEFLGKVSHSGFVPFLGHCLENGNYKFLVYKYMLNKDLSSCLYNREIVSDDVNADCQIPTSLDWAMRLKIAIGVAQGLCYLHHECVPPLVHGNVEARSILIDENFEARIGRLTQVCTEKKDRNQNKISRLLWLPKGIKGGTSGEYATCAYDVYCFGKVLLELVTDHPYFGDHNDSRKKGSMENVLPYITTYDKELFVNIMDPSLVVDKHLLIEVWAVAVVAKACLNPKPSKRPQMSHILEALEHPGSIRFSTHVSLRLAGQLGTVDLPLAKATVPKGISGVGTCQTNAISTYSDSSIGLWNSLLSASSRSEESYPNRVFWDLPNLRIYSFSELKTATKNFRSNRVLGEDGFGRVYKGWLHEKSTSNSGSQSLVAIKRLDPGSMQVFHEWETEIYILGMLSHPNLIKLHGYCWKDKELLLVYEYMQKGRFDNHLFGRGSSIQPLQWDVRLKILIGAARALAFLHALEKQVIYRGFKTSSILIDDSYNAKLSDFGLARMGPSDGQSHVTTTRVIIGTYPYAAPEYIATGQLYVKSDVYGFGVVLAEVLTGLRALDLSRMRGKHNLLDWIKPFLSDKRKIKSIMDSHLEGKYPIKAAIEMAQLAITCLDSDHKARPSMKEVVDALEHIKSAHRIADETRETKDISISYPLPELA